MWWESRREGEATYAYLTRVLKELGPAFAQIANFAEAKHYDDFFCPPEVDDGFNINRLVRDLLAVQVQDPELKRKAIDVAMAARSGEFDGTSEEAKAWGQSPDGKAAFNELAKNTELIKNMGKKGKRNG
jgi:hypothetical protein